MCRSKSSPRSSGRSTAGSGRADICLPPWDGEPGPAPKTTGSVRRCTGVMPIGPATSPGSRKSGSRSAGRASSRREPAAIRSSSRSVCPRQGQYNEGMGSHTVERVAAQLREEISQIIIRALKDARIGMAPITEVKLSPDLRNATLKVSVVGENDARQAAIDGLDHAKGFIRRELGLRLSNLRFAPDLHFQLDEGVAYSVRVSQLLREVQEGEPNAGG